ncbi:unnamed protein product, partial [Polarella glacialis]
ALDPRESQLPWGPEAFRVDMVAAIEFAVLRLMLRASSHASRASGESSGESSARGPSGEQVDPLWAADPCALDGSLRRSKAQKRPFTAGAQAVLTQGGHSRAELLAEQLEGLLGYGSAAKRSGGSGERRQTQGKALRLKRLLAVLDSIHGLLSSGRHGTPRELYYTHVTLFQRQQQSDDVIKRLSRLLE